ERPTKTPTSHEAIYAGHGYANALSGVARQGLIPRQPAFEARTHNHGHQRRGAIVRNTEAHWSREIFGTSAGFQGWSLKTGQPNSLFHGFKDMARLRFLMIGGFLGAGKTTTIARLARHYLGRGQRVGLVTNDQAQDLVDTNSLRAQGFPVEEVPGACFCCRFNDLVDRVKQLEVQQRPDVILAEPVGSCTDLVATVLQPLKDIYGQHFQVAPYAVLFKPSHGLRILRKDSS